MHLVHLQPEVVVQQPEVAHTEEPLHLPLETMHLVLLNSSDDQVIDIDTNDEQCITSPTCIHAMF